MENKAWECPRCGKMNAPFNPSCFCKKEQESILDKILKEPKAQQQYPPIRDIDKRCSTCGGYHGLFNGIPIQCADLQRGLFSHYQLN